MDSLPARLSQATPIEVNGTWQRHVAARFADSALMGRAANGRWGAEGPKNNPSERPRRCGFNYLQIHEILSSAVPCEWSSSSEIAIGGCPADPERLGEFVDGFTSGRQTTKLLLPIGGQLGWFCGRHTTRPAGLPRCCTTLSAQLELQLSEGGHDGGHGAASRRGGVDPFSQGSQQNSSLTEFDDGAGDFGDGSAEAVDCGDDDGVTSAGVVEHGCQPWSIHVGRSGKLVGEDPPRLDTRRSNRGELSVQVLASGADPCVTEDCRHSDDCLTVPYSEDLRHAV